MSYRQVVVAYTANRTALKATLDSDGLKLSGMFAHTSDIYTVGDESILMIKDRWHRLESVLRPLIDAGLMQVFGAKKLIAETDEQGNITGNYEAVYIQNPREPWLDVTGSELETVKRLTNYHVTTDEHGNEIPSGLNWFGGFTWPR